MRYCASPAPGSDASAFQTKIAATKSRLTIVRAGCGSGKTLVAYQWAAERCAGRRLYVCDPTTGTATEGYRDYLFDPASKRGKSRVHLFHS